MCCLKRTDRPQDEKASLHFHEGNGLSHNRREKEAICTLNPGETIYGPLELAMEAAKAKVLKDLVRFRKMRIFLI